MEKRAILAIILSMLVIVIWQLIFAPTPKEPTIREEQVEEAPLQPQRQEVYPEEIPEYAGEEAGVLRDVVVETPLYRAIFTTGGGRLKSWTLKKYTDRKETVVLWRREKVSPPAPVEMVTARGLGELPLETEIRLHGEKEMDLVFDVNADKLSVAENRDGSIVFVGRSVTGLEVVKRYRFYGDEYRVDLDLEIINRSDEAMKTGLRLKWYGVIKPGSRYSFAGPSVLAGGTVDRLSAKAIRKGKSFGEDFEWIASENMNPPEKQPPEGNYFVSIIAPRGVGGVKAAVRDWQISEGDGVGFQSSIILPEVEVAAGADERFSFLLYIGPKLPEFLKELDVEAEKAINFGKYLGSIEKGLLYFLEFTHGLTGNYGVDIIILSVLLKIIFWPLSRKSYKSMQEMQKIQPEMKMLQQKYKDDRQRLNQEMMALYKRRKVNPVGGCLPMLVQFPFLIALYKALPLSFNLRHAPFVLWLRDLSSADSFFIDVLPLPLLGNTPVGPLPLLMGASMLLQQKMSPTMGDPRQAKMMMIMPIMFIFIFLGFPSGLVLYWFVQNLLSIGEQYYTKRKGS